MPVTSVLAGMAEAVDCKPRATISPLIMPAKKTRPDKMSLANETSSYFAILKSSIQEPPRQRSIFAAGR
jgi:hypothetical protein